MADMESPGPFDGAVMRQDVLQVLADPTCRAILQVLADRTRTAAELAETLEMPLSTVYRKLDALIATPLVDTTIRLRADGHHAREYRCTFDRVSVWMARRRDQSLRVHVS